LGLRPAASAQEIKEAHRRLAQRVDPQSGGTSYLAMKIDEAKTILLGE
jgi:DnaJ-class molecular chaperone